MIHHHQCECCVNCFNVKCLEFFKHCYINPSHYHFIIIIILKISLFFGHINVISGNRDMLWGIWIKNSETKRSWGSIKSWNSPTHVSSCRGLACGVSGRKRTRTVEQVALKTSSAFVRFLTATCCFHRLLLLLLHLHLIYFSFSLFHRFSDSDRLFPRPHLTAGTHRWSISSVPASHPQQLCLISASADIWNPSTDLYQAICWTRFLFTLNNIFMSYWMWCFALLNLPGKSIHRTSFLSDSKSTDQIFN